MDNSNTDQSVSSSAALLGRSLREWRVAQGLKLADCAAQLGVAVSTWSHWENARGLPSGENLLLLTRLTGIELQHLLCPNASRCPFRHKETPHPAPCADEDVTIWKQ